MLLLNCASTSTNCNVSKLIILYILYISSFHSSFVVWEFPVIVITIYYDDIVVN